MIKDIEIFDIAHNAKKQREIFSQINNEIMRHLFIKHYLFCFIKQVTVIRYLNKEKQANHDRILIAKICEVFDQLFFGFAYLTEAAFEYSTEHQFIVEIPHKEYKVCTATAAAEIRNMTTGQILPKLLVYKQKVCGDIFKYYNFVQIPPDMINSVVKIGKFNLGIIDLIFNKKNSSVEFNEKTENELRRRLDIGDTSALLFSPVGPIEKMFPALNTLFANAITNTPTQTEQQTEPANTDKPKIAKGWGNLGKFGTEPANEPQTTTATVGGWGNLGKFGTDEVSKKTSSNDEKDETQTEQQQTTETIENMMKNADYSEILPAISISTDTSAAQFIDALSIHEFKHTKAAKAVIQYILNVVAPDCMRKLQKGEIKTALDYHVEPQPREILRMLGETISTKAARNIEAAIIELHEKPLKYTRYADRDGKKTVIIDSFQVITHLHTENNKIIWFNFAPSIVTAGHVVNRAFKRYSSVKKLFADGKYILSADITDIDTIVNHILNCTKPGDEIFWQRIFEEFIIADTNNSRVQRKILDGFNHRGFDTKKINKLCFVYAPKKDTAAAEVAKTAEIAKATANELAKIKKKTTRRATKKTTKKTTKKEK